MNEARPEAQSDPVIVDASQIRPWLPIDDNDDDQGAIHLQKQPFPQHSVTHSLYGSLDGANNLLTNPATPVTGRQQHTRATWEVQADTFPRTKQRESSTAATLTTPTKPGSASSARRRYRKNAKDASESSATLSKGKSQRHPSATQVTDTAELGISPTTTANPCFPALSQGPSPDSAQGNGSSSRSSSVSRMATDGREGSKKPHRKKPDPDQEAVPPRPPNAFILYRSAHSAASFGANDRAAKGDTSEEGRKSTVPSEKIIPLEASMPATPKHQQSLSKFIAERWNSEPPAVKEFWYTEAQKKKRLHEVMYPDYKFQPRSSEKVKQERESRASKRQEEPRESSSDPCKGSRRRERSSSRGAFGSNVTRKSPTKKPYAAENGFVRQHGKTRSSAAEIAKASKEEQPLLQHESRKGREAATSKGKIHSVDSTTGYRSDANTAAATPSLASSFSSVTTPSPKVVQGDVFFSEKDALSSLAESNDAGPNQRLGPQAIVEPANCTAPLEISNASSSDCVHPAVIANEEASLSTGVTAPSSLESAEAVADMSDTTLAIASTNPLSPIRVEVDIERLLRLDSATICELLGIPSSSSHLFLSDLYPSDSAPAAGLSSPQQIRTSTHTSLYTPQMRHSHRHTLSTTTSLSHSPLVQHAHLHGGQSRHDGDQLGHLSLPILDADGHSVQGPCYPSSPYKSWQTATASTTITTTTTTQTTTLSSASSLSIGSPTFPSLLTPSDKPPSTGLAFPGATPEPGTLWEVVGEVDGENNPFPE